MSNISNQLRQMRYVFIPHVQQVPQWKQLYYNSKALYTLIGLCQKTDQIITQLRGRFHNLQKMSYKEQYKQQNSKNKNKRKSKSIKQIQIFNRLQHLSRIQLKLGNIKQESSRKFYQYSHNQMQTLYLFSQYKIFEIKDRISKLTQYSKITDRNQQNLISLIQNTYIQTHYLKRMIEYNRSQQSICIRQYQLYLHNHQTLYQSIPNSRKLDRIQNIVNININQLQKLYLIKKSEIQTTALKQLMLYGDHQLQQENQRFIYRIGFGMGLLIICLSGLLFFKQYHNITPQLNKIYAGDFPVWRGASYIIFYQWMLGFSFLFLQSTQINYKLILTLESQTVPKPQQILYNAQNITIVYVVFYCIYLLQMAKVLTTNFKYWGHVVWLIIIVYYLLPIPYANNKGKYYILKLFFKVLISPFTLSNGLLIWITEQLVSNSQTFSDFFYTCCKLNDINSKCLFIPDATIAIIIILFSFRFTQNTKMLKQNNWKIIPPFYGLFRIITSVFLAVMSWIYRKRLLQKLPSQDYYRVFVFSGLLSTIVAFLVDLKTDWGMLNGQLLRKNLFFSKSMYLYYIIIFIDFFLRANWSLNLSPTFVQSLNILPYYMIMIVTYLQLFRRAMWNILRVQLEHAESCAKFKATIVDTQIENQLKQKYKIKDDPNQNNIQIKRQKIIRNNQQLQLLNQNLRNRSNYKKSIFNFIDKKKIEIQQIQQQLKLIHKKKQK